MPLLLQDNGGSYIYGPGGMLLEDVVGTSSTDVYYYHGDRLGSVRALTSSTGAVANTYTYDAYGKTLTSTGSVSNPFKYTGEYTDAESGFIYLRARYYDPESRQFLTVDPALAWTEEAYAYGGGSPTNGTDPLGLVAYLTHGEAAALAQMLRERFPMHGETDHSVPPVSVIPEAAEQWNTAQGPYRAAYMGVKEAEALTEGMSKGLNILTLIVGFGEMAAENVAEQMDKDTIAFNALADTISSLNSCAGVAIQRTRSQWQVMNRLSGKMGEADGREFDQTVGIAALIDAWNPSTNDRQKALAAPFYLTGEAKAVPVCLGSRPCVFQNPNP